MKQWILAILTVCFAACAAEVLDDADEPVVASDEELVIGCRATADLAAKQYLQFIFNAADNEMHWIAAENAYQVGGQQWHQPTRGRGDYQLSGSSSRAVRVTFCSSSSCAYWATYVCGCGGFYSCEFK